MIWMIQGQAHSAVIVLNSHPRRPSMTRSWRLTLVSFWVFLIAIIASAAHAQEPKDVIARVGDQTISLHEIDTMINSSSVVGLDIPPPGTPERNAARLSLLDKVISAD